MDFRQRYKYDHTKDFLGKGGFSEVYKAHDTLLDREVAIKFFNAKANEKYDVINEIKRIIRFQHPNIVRYYDVTLLKIPGLHGEVESGVGIMEYVNSGNLVDFMKTRPESELLKQVLIGILQGLQYLHENHIVHRDIKPQNILLHSEHGKLIAKICDFGISKNLESSHSSSSSLLGTIEYMAPEQFSPKKYGKNGRLSTNVDLWSFGVVLYELLTGSLPFGKRGSGISSEQIMSNILNESPQPSLATIPAPYKEVIELCFVKNAAERVQSAEALLKILQREEKPQKKESTESTEVLKKSAASIPEKESASKSEKENKSKSKVFAAIFIAVFLCGIGVLIWKTSGSASTSESAAVTSQPVFSGSEDSPLFAAGKQTLPDSAVTQVDTACAIQSTASEVISNGGNNMESAPVAELSQPAKPIKSKNSKKGPYAVCSKNLKVVLDATCNPHFDEKTLGNGSSADAGIKDMKISPSSFSCNDDCGAKKFVLTVTDSFGRSSTCTAFVAIIDKVNPKAKCKDADKKIRNGETVSIAASDIDDGSSDACGIRSMEVSPPSFSSQNIGKQDVKLTVVDSSGNRSFCTAKVNIEPASGESEITKGAESEILKDARDNKQYKTVKIGSQIWMAENLNYKTSDSWCYDNDNNNCNKYGRLYTWNAAKKACPEGWRLPSDKDWKVLERTLGMTVAASDSSNYRGTNQGAQLLSDKHIGFMATLGGYFFNNSFNKRGEDGQYWTATSEGDKAWKRVFSAQKAQVYRSQTNVQAGLSCRCIKN